MANISIPNTFVDGTLMTAAASNANNSEIQTKYNAGAVQTDVAKTITVQHTMTAGLAITGGTLAAQATTTAALTASGLVTSATGLKSGSQTVAQFGTSDAAPVRVTVSNTTNTSVDLQADESGITHIDLTLQAAGGTVGLGTKVTAGASSGDTIVPNAASVRGVTAAGTGTKRLLGLTASNQVSIDADGVGTVFGAALPSPHMTSPVVDSGGIAVTGNSTVTGNLNVTGALTTGSTVGLVSVVAQGADFTNTTTTPTTSGLSVALGANQTWRVEFDLGIACNGAGGVWTALTYPAGATGRMLTDGSTNSSSTIFNSSNALSSSPYGGWAANSGVSYVRYVVYIATSSTAGTLAMQIASVTATQTSTLQAGSTMLATRIS